MKTVSMNDVIMNDVDDTLFLETPEAKTERDAVLHPKVSPNNNIQASSSPAQPFKFIGWGSCGLVYSQHGASTVVKLAKQGRSKDLENDSNMHQIISQQFKKYNVKDIQIPEWISFQNNDQKPNYFDRIPMLQEAVGRNCDLPTSTLVTERILPLPRAVQILFILQQCPKKVISEALESEGNRDCLVRIYLGSKRGYSGPSKSNLFSLRNIPLHLDQMAKFGVNYDSTARSIGQAMAIMHWAAKTDAQDVEFVLGRTLRSSSESAPWHMDFEAVRNYRHSIRLWVLDFNRVQPITMDEAGVAKAVRAAKLNAPYIPKFPYLNGESDSADVPENVEFDFGWDPNIEVNVWKAFVESYLFHSGVIFGGDTSLPKKFIYGLTVE